MFNKNLAPSDEIIRQLIGDDVLVYWDMFRDYLKEAYNMEPELLYYGQKHGWCLRYRKSKRTLCTIFPEKGAFTVLVILGSRELAKLEHHFLELNSKMQTMIQTTHKEYDGKWLWIQVKNDKYVNDVKTLLSVKRKPKNR
ncbi:DUF3788 domain-containing protein [bacterium]|nr:DUF3788 domain-containing protein [bacterium]